MKGLKKKRKWIILGAAAAAVVLISIIGASMNGAEVESAVVDKGQVIKLIKESGTVEAENTVVIAAKNSGEIRKVLVEEGDRVTAGSKLMESEVTSAQMDIKSLQSDLAGLQAQYNQAKNLADKNKTLYEQGALSYEDYNASNTAAKQLSAQISSLSYTIKSYEESSGAAGVTAPINGTVTEVFIKAGETVTAGASLFEISDLSNIYVKVDLIAEDADLVQVGDPVKVYNEDAGFTDENCKVRKIHVKAQEKMSDLGINQKRVTIEIALSQSTALRLGSNLDIEISVDQRENAVRVSDKAVFELENKDYVYVVSDGKAVLREVELGLEGEDFIEVLSGLEEGDVIILSPEDEIQEGTKVKV
ncbi:efflux RND transporter periplasmic adaptor subunit [Sinanaerobacter chloroacetimidivorans]|jgi:HlyD family secretion protein|uniref:Efflux RND transporter periplasmic adaptor subunit n=1 Tax=Sinanaerobacter chloroacetimidivorans TaxID=2818044 RepID=A0A8J8B217_9FIRM|nr:efflux RND transporter periplasmic adaptor subunit [Sinanaerobacter chloroacetimidivorans]MBR0598297.1 efflux RND transporter periplasmic adaptor subunit [Sinanaerobacter chloroacetimidivorans]